MTQPVPVDQPESNSTTPLGKKTIIGVGVGPGDPELITVKALKALGTSDVIFVPTTEAKENAVGRAEEIVMANLPEHAGKIRRIPFAMSERSGVGEKRRRAWRVSADAAIEAFQDGAERVAFATIGDPSVFSTFSYLCDIVRQTVADLDVIVVPGITAMQAIAAATTTPLCEGKEILCLAPATVGEDKLRQVCAVADTVTIYKGGRQLQSITAILDDADRLETAVIGTDIGLASQRLDKVTDLTEESAPYFSTVLTVSSRTTTGGRL